MKTNDLPFLSGGGEMGEMTRRYDWTSTSLGAPETWPQSLRTVLGLLLNSRFPMFLFWGPEHLCFYNDAYRPSLGDGGHHPSALGKPAKKVWPEIWDVIGPLIGEVMSGGEATWEEDKLLPILRNGNLEDVYWTASYSPVRDESGAIAGVFATCLDCTDAVTARHRLEKSEQRLQQTLGAAAAASRSVAESELQMRTFIEQSPVASCLFMGADMRISIANRQMLDIWGKGPDIIGQPLSTAVPETEGQPVRLLVQQVMTGGISLEGKGIETQMKVEGIPATRYYDSFYKPLLDSEGRVQGVMAVAVDVTERHVASRRIEAREKELLSLFDQSPVAIAVLDGEDLRFSMANEFYASLSGRRSEDLIGRPLLEAMPEVKGQGFDQLLRNVLETGDPFIIHNTPVDLVRKGRNDRLYVNLTYHPIRDIDTGRAGRILAVVTDVTDQVVSIQRTEAKQREILSLFNQSPVAVATLDRQDLTFRVANPFYGDLVGRKPEEIIGKPLLEALPEIEGQGFVELLNGVLDTGIPFISPQVSVDLLRNEKLERVYVNLAYQPLREEDGSINTILVVATDVTPQVLERQSAEASQQELLSLFDQSPVGIALLTGDRHTFVLVNSFYETLVGRSREQLLGKPVMDALPELEGQGFDQLLNGVFTTGQAYVADGVPVELLRNGRIEKVFVNFAYQPVRNPEGVITGVLAVVTDTTAQTTAHKLVEESEAKFRTLIEEAPYATTLYVGKDLIVETPNAEMLKIWGKSKEVVGLPLIEALPELEGQPFIGILEEVMRTGITYFTSEQAADLMIDGRLQTFWFSFTYKPLLDAEGNCYAILNMAVDITERVQARNALAESEAKFRGVIAAAPAGIGLFIGRDLIIESPNQTFIDIVGKGPGVEGLPLREAMPELITEGQPFLKILDDVYTTGVPFISPASLVKIVQNGVLNDNYYNISYTPLRNAEGEIYGILDIAIDVTAEVRLREELKEKTEELEQALDIGDLGSYRLDLVTGTATFSRRIMDWFGFDQPEVPMAELFYRIHPQDQEAVNAAIQKTFDGENGGYHDIVYRLAGTADSPLRYLHSTGQAQWEEGKPVVLAGIIQDVTDSTLKRMALQESEAALRNATDLAQLAGWSVDLISNTITYSDRFATWNGLNTRTLELSELPTVAPEDRERVADAFRETIAENGSGRLDVVYTVVHAQTGQRRIIHVVGNVVQNNEGNITGVRGTAQDITVQQESQMALEQEVQLRTQEVAESMERLELSNRALLRSNEELAQFAYVASHDLQEPLRKIQLFSSMLTNVHDIPPRVMDTLGKITKSANRMTVLIQDLLNFSRLLKADKLYVPVDLNRIVHEVRSDYEVMIGEKQATFHIDALPTVDAVPFQMQQLFYNLIGNALKFSKQDSPPVVTITCQEEMMNEPGHLIPGKHFRFEVSDNGIGFKQEYAVQIFEVFKRLHLKEVYAGTGIGLSLCKRIVENHRGTITAESQPGEGAIFRFVLPAKQA